MLAKCSFASKLLWNCCCQIGLLAGAPILLRLIGAAHIHDHGRLLDLCLGCVRSLHQHGMRTKNEQRSRMLHCDAMHRIASRCATLGSAVSCCKARQSASWTTLHHAERQHTLTHISSYSPMRKTARQEPTHARSPCIAALSRHRSEPGCGCGEWASTRTPGGTSASRTPRLLTGSGRAKPSLRNPRCETLVAVSPCVSLFMNSFMLFLFV